jgi:hypothetical protein
MLNEKGNLMRTSIVIAALMTLFSTSALAEWTLVDSNNDYDTHVNLSTIRRIGNKAKVWSLTDYKTIQKEIDRPPYLSSSIHRGFDCEAETHSFLYRTDYSDNMGGGKVTSNLVMGHIDYPIQPDSISEAFWKIACGKK